MNFIKYFIACAGIIVIFMLFPSLLMLGGGGGTVPVEPPASEDKAGEYMSVCRPLGAPWDLVMLTDAYMAVQEDRSEIEDINPLVTALEFLILEEWIENLEQVGTETNEDGEEEPVYEWVVVETNQYIGREEIMEYADISESEIEDIDSEFINGRLLEISEQKSSETVKYSLTFIRNEDLVFVLREFIGMNDENIKKALDIYESGYLVALYTGYSGNGMGSAMFAMLMEEAVKHMGKPYTMESGRNQGPDSFDCSGFMWWIFQKSGVYEHVRQTAQGYYDMCTPVTEPEPGDLVFYTGTSNHTSNPVTHVGMYIGNNQMIHTGGRPGVTIENIWPNSLYGYGRMPINLNEDEQQSEEGE